MMGLTRTLLSWFLFFHLTGHVLAAATVDAPQDGLPASLNFEPVGVYFESDTYHEQTLSLSNKGTAVLMIDSILTTGDFVQQNNCGSGLAVGDQCQIRVSFRPTARGIQTGTLSIVSNAPSSPHRVALSGTPSDFAVYVIYADNGDGTVTDPKTGLTWMRCPLGQTWDGNACTGDAASYTWAQAKALAGQNGWRLPNIRELTTIMFTGTMFGPLMSSNRLAPPAIFSLSPPSA